jgi:hypothetical protein
MAGLVPAMSLTETSTPADRHAQREPGAFIGVKLPMARPQRTISFPFGRIDYLTG